jgi:hypothetical protein
MGKRKGRDKPKIASLLRLAALGLTATALVKELRTPSDQREWHGKLAGVVPYDFRVPTRARLRAAFWSPDSDRLLTPQVFGVGWTLNLGRLVKLVRS